MIKKNEQIGLCTNCLNIQICFYYKNTKKPVRFCEEFICKDPGISTKDLERLKRAETMFLPKTNQGLFDDCGKTKS